MKIIKIIMATTADELKNERKELGDYIRTLNDHYYTKGIYFRLDNLLDFETEEEKEQEVCDSEFFYIIFSDEADESIVNKFDVALRHFKAKDSPRIYTYFQKLPDSADAAQSVKDFMIRLDKEIGHYYSMFLHLDSIKLNMLLELTRTQMVKGTVDIKDGKALIDGKPMLSLENVPIFRDNEEFCKLIKERDELRKKKIELASKYVANPEDEEVEQQHLDCTIKMKEVIEQIHQIEKEILSVCMDVTEITNSGKPMSWRERAACKCFDTGDYKGALAVLSDPNLEIELEQTKEINALSLNCFSEYIRVKRLNIKGLKALGVNVHTLPSIYDCYEKAVQVAEEYSVETDIIYEYASFLFEQKKYNKSLEKAEWLYKFYKKKDKIEALQEGRLYILLGVLFETINKTNAYIKAENAFKHAEVIFKRLAEEDFDTYGDALARVYNGLGVLYQKNEMLQKASDKYKKAYGIYERLAANKPEKYVSCLADNYNNLGCLLTETNDYQAAEEEITKSIAIWEKLRKRCPEEAVNGIAISYINLGNLYYRMGRTKEAEEIYKKANDLYKELASTNPAYISDLAISFHNLAVALQKNKNYQESEAAYKKAIDSYESIVEDDWSAFTKNLIISYDNYCDLLSEIKKTDSFFLNKLSDEEKELAVLGILLTLINFQYDGPAETKQKALSISRKLDKNEWIRAITIVLDFLKRDE